MATIEKLLPLLFKWEGGYVNDPDDRGGATNMGVTLRTWQDVGYDKNGDGRIDEKDLKLLTREDVVEHVLRPHYWNRWQADRIHNQSVANLLVDWLWHSGEAGIKIPQRILRVKDDGIVGEKTLSALNSYYNQKELFMELKEARETWLLTICRTNPKHKRFKEGWLNRLKSFTFRATPLFLLIFLAASCRSSASLQTIRQEIRSSEKTKSDSTVYEQHKSTGVSTLAKEQTGEEILLSETLTIRYDTSQAPDPETKSYPVLEQVRTILTKTIRMQQKEQALRRDTTENLSQQELRFESDYRQENKGSARTQHFPIRNVIIVGIGLLVIVAFGRRWYRK